MVAPMSGGAMPPRPTRLFMTNDILDGRVTLDAYPFRYICLTALPPGGFAQQVQVSVTGEYNAIVDRLLSAVELLETQGWELVTVDGGGLVAFLRRHAPR